MFLLKIIPALESDSYEICWSPSNPGVREAKGESYRGRYEKGFLFQIHLWFETYKPY